jgi:hypothetical protein
MVIKYSLFMITVSPSYIHEEVETECIFYFSHSKILFPNLLQVSGFLWVIKIPSAHFLRRGSKKLSVPCRRFTACKRTLHSMNEMLCRPNFLTCFSPVIFSCFATRWLWLLNQADSKRCCGSRLATCSSNTLNQAMKPY